MAMLIEMHGLSKCAMTTLVTEATRVLMGSSPFTSLTTNDSPKSQKICLERKLEGFYISSSKIKKINSSPKKTASVGHDQNEAVGVGDIANGDLLVQTRLRKDDHLILRHKSLGQRLAGGLDGNIGVQFGQACQ